MPQYKVKQSLAPTVVTKPPIKRPLFKQHSVLSLDHQTQNLSSQRGEYQLYPPPPNQGRSEQKRESANISPDYMAPADESTSVAININKTKNFIQKNKNLVNKLCT
jgi:hypothetical protein